MKKVEKRQVVFRWRNCQVCMTIIITHQQAKQSSIGPVKIISGPRSPDSEHARLVTVSRSCHGRRVLFLARLIVGGCIDVQNGLINSVCRVWC